MGNICSRLCSKSDSDEASPGDRAFDAGVEAYDEFQRIYVSQRHTSGAQDLLTKALKSYNHAKNYYRRTNDPNLGAALVNMATVKWDMYHYTNETDEKNPARLANLLEEVIKLSDDALALWQVHEPKPAQYPTLLANLATAYRERFVRNNQNSDIQQAIQLYKDTCNHTEKTSRPHAEAVKDLGITYWGWYNESSTATRMDEHLQSAIQYLMDADRIAREKKYPDIQYTCLYTLACINHQRFEIQEDLKPSNPTPQYLDDAIHFYRSTLQIGMPQTDPRYAKTLWFVPLLLFHRYERDNSGGDLQEAKTRARDAVTFSGITDEEQRRQLTAVRDFDPAARLETTRPTRIAMRKSRASSFHSNHSTASLRSTRAGG